MTDDGLDTWFKRLKMLGFLPVRGYATVEFYCVSCYTMFHFPYTQQSETVEVAMDHAHRTCPKALS